jgi:hypothetical protein
MGKDRFGLSEKMYTLFRIYTLYFFLGTLFKYPVRQAVRCTGRGHIHVKMQEYGAYDFQ